MIDHAHWAGKCMQGPVTPACTSEQAHWAGMRSCVQHVVKSIWKPACNLKPVYVLSRLIGWHAHLCAECCEECFEACKSVCVSKHASGWGGHAVCCDCQMEELLMALIEQQASQ